MDERRRSERVLVTGSAGYVGRLVRPLLRDEFDLCCLDLREDPTARAWGDEVIRGDAADLAVAEAACHGVDAVVHLAANPRDEDFLTELVPRNVIGTWAILEAAHRAGVPRVVLASTIQTALGGRRRPVVAPEDPPRPMSLYACTKVFAEAVGRFHAEQHGLGVACLRIGWLAPDDSPWFDTEPDFPGLWCSPSDLARLIVAAIRSDVPFATVFAVSKPADRRFDCRNPFGWAPVEHGRRAVAR